MYQIQFKLNHASLEPYFSSLTGHSLSCLQHPEQLGLLFSSPEFCFLLNQSRGFVVSSHSSCAPNEHLPLVCFICKNNGKISGNSCIRAHVLGSSRLCCFPSPEGGSVSPQPHPVLALGRQAQGSPAALEGVPGMLAHVSLFSPFVWTVLWYTHTVLLSGKGSI